GGPFLWHYPSARADWTLSSTLPYGARTFLPRPLCRRRLSVKLSKSTLVSIQGIPHNHKYESPPMLTFYAKPPAFFQSAELERLGIDRRGMHLGLILMLGELIRQPGRHLRLHDFLSIMSRIDQRNSRHQCVLGRMIIDISGHEHVGPSEL